MKNKVRVLHIFSGYGGGISSLIKNLIENQNDSCIFDTMAFSYANGDNFVRLIEEKGGKALTMPRIRIEGFHALNKFIHTKIKPENYDVVHCHLSSFTAFPFLLACKKNGIKKVIIHAHSTVQDSWWDRLPLLYQIGQWINYRYSDVFFTCSDLAANYVFGRKYLSKRKVTLIPNGINEIVFKNTITAEEKNSYRKEFGIASDVLVLMHMGRFNIQKNHVFMLKILKSLLERKKNVVLLFAGEGELQQEIKEKAQLMGLYNNIRFLNRRNDVSLLMQFADCVLLPSHNEGLPTVAIECQASGTPILISDHITKQCDMGLGLIKFLKIDDENIWVENILKGHNKLPVDYCVNQIKNEGFTAKEAGINYCEFLRKLSV